MSKRILVVSVLLAFCATGLWAGGSKDNESRAAEDPAGFTDSIDINEKKTGKWNYYLEATDKAGNISLSGPENIYVDPESDLPRVTTINPLPDMRVQGNLNIVGIAVDDDGVSFVELTVTRGKDGKGEELVRVRAEGSDYWSYFLNTTDPAIWTDGVYTITAWATDINGLSGISDDFKPKQHKIHQVYWNLDRKKPDTTVDSHEVGALVSGKIRLRGKVYDGNGIKSFAYSVDGGNRYITTNTSFNKSAGANIFDISLDTKIFDDGPAVIWFKAQDGQGTLGTAAHLLFANNTGPEVSIAYPTPDTTVNGVFSIAGSASHPVGIKSVTWKAGKQGGEFPLLIGNPWWSADVDLRGEKTSSIDVEIRAEDVSGNVTVYRQKYRVDQNADLPIVTLQLPAANTILDENGEIVVMGAVNDDDGAASLFYSLDGRPAEEIICPGAFQFTIPQVDEGTHTLEVWAKDITGITGPKVLVRGITIPGALPEPGISTVTTGSGSAAQIAQFYTGMNIRMEPKIRTQMEFTVKAASLASSTVTFGDMNAVSIRPAAGKDGVMRATVQVPANLPSGYTKIEIKTTDKYGREVVFPEYVFIDNPSVGDAPYGRWFNWVRPNELSSGLILLGSREDTLIGLANSPITSAALRGTGSDSLSIDVDENGRVLLRARREGSFGPLTVSAIDNTGRAIDSSSFRITADFTGPSIRITDAPEGRWVQTSAPVSFSVSGANRVTSVDYSLDMGSTWLNISSSDGSLSRTIDLRSVPDGSINVLLRAMNEAGRSATANFTVLKDTQNPQAALVMPISGARVNGTIRMGFSIKEFGSLNSVRYQRPATGNRAAINREVYNTSGLDKDYQPMFLEVLMDSTDMPLDGNMRFSFEDRAGNRSEVTAWPFTIDTQMDIPTVHVILPLDNEVITTDFIVSGVMFDDDAIEKVYWRIDSGQERELIAANGFSIPIALSTLTDNEHSVTVTAQDIYGVKSAPVTRGFRVSLSEPAAAVTYPAFDTILRETIEIRGTSFDRNGIDGLQISVDNGNTFNTVYGTTTWNYRFNTKILKDGAHVVFIRVWDRYGIPATYASMINVDNTPPDITLDSPGDGTVSTGKVQLMGRTLDPNLDTVTIEFRSLQGATIRQDLRSQSLGNSDVIKQTLDIASQPDGLYNIEIVGTDKAGNVTRISRNVQLARQTLQNFVEIFYPLDNENVQGVFNLYGYAGGTDAPGSVTIRINGQDRITNDVDDSGFWNFNLSSDVLSEGVNSITVYSNFGGNRAVQSRTQNVVYKQAGPWITIDSFNFGDFAFDRPYLFGRTGYALSPEDEEALASKETDSETKSQIRNKKPDITEISFDNGKTFTKTSGSFSKDVDYRYRLETGEMTEGLHYILVKSTMKNGESAITRMLVQVDKTPPVIRLISPEPGGRYNQEIAYSASATDDVELISLTYHLRKGDKAFYAVPGFLGGLYFEAIIPPFLKQLVNDAPTMPFGGGATYMDVGFGLSFFEDNVKIQAQYGFMTQDLFEAMGGEGPVRYGGHVLGIKLLASIYRLPFGSFAGPDWEWLSATLALGANFSLFDMGLQGYTQSGKRTWMSALLMQIEFPKVTIPKRKNLRTFALFTEGQLWFVPTDVDAEALGIETIIPHIILGLRLYIF
jgi:hypothetical protein